MPDRRHMAGLLVLSVGIAASGPITEAAGVTPERAAALERLVTQDCGSCHGLTLRGGLGSAITPDRMRHYEREALRDLILDGLPGTAMPAWRPLMTDADALWIADYLRSGKAP